MSHMPSIERPPEAPPRSASPGRDERGAIAVAFVGRVDEVSAGAGAYDQLVVSADLPNSGALEIVRAAVSSQPAIRVFVMGLAEAHQVPRTYIEAGATGWLL